MTLAVTTGLSDRSAGFTVPWPSADSRRDMPRTPQPQPTATTTGPDLEAITRRMQARHAVRVKRWRKSMSGCAWQDYYADGRVVKWIEAPYPKSTLSLSIFLHEIGHHVIGFDRFKKRCEEEYHVWLWALDEMRRLGIEPDEKVLRRFDASMRYAVDKAVRRGIKELPSALQQFLTRAA